MRTEFLIKVIVESSSLVEHQKQVIETLVSQLNADDIQMYQCKIKFETLSLEATQVENQQR